MPTDHSPFLAGRKIKGEGGGGRAGEEGGDFGPLCTSQQDGDIKSRTNRKRGYTRLVKEIAGSFIYFSWRGGRKRLNASLSGNYDNLCGRNCGLARYTK